MYEYEKNHLRALRKGLAECTVLLKNKGDFPLHAAGPIAAYGNGVRHTIKGGTGSGEVNSRFFINVEQGLEKAGFTITTKDWLDAYDAVLVDAKKQFMKDLKAEAKRQHQNVFVMGMGAVMPEPEHDLPVDAEGDTAIYVLSRISGEGNDRKAEKGDLKLSDTEVRMIREIHDKYEHFMLVINAGGPVDLTPVLEVAENILVLSQLGVETGFTLARILLGKENPSGKLTTTWAATDEYCQEGQFGERSDTEYREGIYVGYRYFDTVGKKAEFPFGFGLSYTTFGIAPGEVRTEGDLISVKATVTNTGAFSGKEVVQVYLSKPDGKLDQPYQELVGFGKTRTLRPEEAEELTVQFRLRDFASYDEEMSAYVLEAGDYVLRVGNSSVDTCAVAILRLADQVIVRKVRKALGEPGFVDFRPEKKVDVVDAPIIWLEADAIETETIVYDQEQEIDPFVQKLTDEQLGLINIGSFNPKGGILSVIGDASSSVAGAAGQTTEQIPGMPSLVMADGPAGLRLMKQYYIDEKGVHGFGPSLPESIAEMLPKPVRLIMNRKPHVKKGIEIMDQYATAIPIGTAIAQSFNLDFAEVCGDVVGAEMELMHVHLWLAPALNIHRSVLCGRNFEYYSEDPFISGRMAAAITRGVQNHPGCGTTIKHYAANNQEAYRYTNNSKVSERAMREIYLRGFEICVREAQPKAVMSSYNLLNGKHTSERRDLCQDILRDEFGFKGILMTDWVIAMMAGHEKYEAAKAGNVAKASGELFMPGSKKDLEHLLGLLNEGKLTRKQLEINATHVYRMAKELDA